MSEKKPYLVDVPVRVNIWIRPECQKRQFEILKQVRPSIIFLQSDGGRNEKEWEAIRENRKLIDEGIDWECTVYRLYEEKNNGLYAMGKKTAELVWSKVDRCIFLEDDYVPSVSFFAFAAELLEKYKEDTRIHTICSQNYSGVWEDASADYFFCERGSIWGTATWKRVYEQRENALNYAKDPYTMGLLKERIKKDKCIWKDVKGYAENDLHNGHVPGAEFFKRFDTYARNQLYIIPKYNMMNNIGCSDNSAHAAEYKLMVRSIRRLFNMKTYEYTSPLKHPEYMIADKKYKAYEEKILGRNRPILCFFRRIESVLLVLRYRGLQGLIVRLKRAVKRRKTIET